MNLSSILQYQTKSSVAILSLSRGELIGPVLAASFSLLVGKPKIIQKQASGPRRRESFLAHTFRVARDTGTIL